MRKEIDMRDIREYRGYTIEKITAKDWGVKDRTGRFVYTSENRIPRTLKEAKATVDADIRRTEFVESMFAELCVDISDSELEMDEIIYAVENKYNGWKFKGTTIKLNGNVVAVFEPVF